MEDIIQDSLDEIYKNIEIKVDFKDYNLYKIEISKLDSGLTIFEYKYDNYFTKDENIKNICKEIDKIILSHYKI